jgi:hypothetical protein
MNEADHTQADADRWVFTHLRWPMKQLTPVTRQGHYAEFPTTAGELAAMLHRFLHGGRAAFAPLVNPKRPANWFDQFSDNSFTCPALAVLTAPSGHALSLWLGPELSSVEWHDKPGYSNSRMLLADCPYTDRNHEFLWEGHHSVVDRESIVPTQQVIDIALYFFAHRTCPDGLHWSRVSLFFQDDFELPAEDQP